MARPRLATLTRSQSSPSDPSPPVSPDPFEQAWLRWECLRRNPQYRDGFAALKAMGLIEHDGVLWRMTGPADDAAPLCNEAAGGTPLGSESADGTLLCIKTADGSLLWVETASAYARRSEAADATRSETDRAYDAMLERWELVILPNPHQPAPKAIAYAPLFVDFPERQPRVKDRAVLRELVRDFGNLPLAAAASVGHQAQAIGVACWGAELAAAAGIADQALAIGYALGLVVRGSAWPDADHGHEISERHLRRFFDKKFPVRALIAADSLEAQATEIGQGLGLIDVATKAPQGFQVAAARVHWRLVPEYLRVFDARHQRLNQPPIPLKTVARDLGLPLTEARRRYEAACWLIGMRPVCDIIAPAGDAPLPIDVEQSLRAHIADCAACQAGPPLCPVVTPFFAPDTLPPSGWFELGLVAAPGILEGWRHRRPHRTDDSDRTRE